MFGLDIGSPVSYALIRRYGDCLMEEMKEAEVALKHLRMAFMTKREGDPAFHKLCVELLKELQDVHYTASSLAVAFGWDEDEAFRRVHQSNMSKLDDNGRPVFRADGKIVKSHNYQPAVLEDLV